MGKKTLTLREEFRLGNNLRKQIVNLLIGLDCHELTLLHQTLVLAMAASKCPVQPTDKELN